MINDFIIPNNTKRAFISGYGWIGPFNAQRDANQHVIDWLNQQDDEDQFVY